MDKLIAYLEGMRYADIFPEDKKGTAEPESVCLLCLIPFTCVCSLTRHVHQCHSDDFSEPFPCPECQRNGTIDMVNAGIQAWSRHTLQVHRKNNTPNPFPKKRVPKHGINMHGIHPQSTDKISIKSEDKPPSKRRYVKSRT